MAPDPNVRTFPKFMKLIDSDPTTFHSDDHVPKGCIYSSDPKLNPNEQSTSTSAHLVTDSPGPFDKTQNHNAPFVAPNEMLATSNDEHQKVIAELTGHNQLLIAENGQLSALKDKLAATNDESQKANGRLKARNESLVAQIDQLHAEAQSLKQTWQRDVAHLQGQVDSYRNQNEILIDERQKLSTSIAELRTHMYAKGMSHSPRHPDQYYVDKFARLNGLLEQGLADFSEDNSDKFLTDIGADNLLRYLQQLKPEGPKTYDLLTNRKSRYPLHEIYKDDHLRVLLLRHVAALYLLHRVFKPFASGISTNISDFFTSILETEKKRGIFPLRKSALLGGRFADHG